MKQLDFTETDKPFTLDLHFNNIFLTEINEGLIKIIQLKTFALTETNWLTKAEQEVQKELMSWKDKK